MRHEQNREIQSKAYAFRGLVHLKLGHITSAFSDIQEAMDLDPASSYPYYFKGLVLIHLEAYEVASPLLEEAIALGLSTEENEIAESLLRKYSNTGE